MLLYFICGFACIVLLLVFFLARKLWRRSHVLDCAWEWIDLQAEERYAPMLRLLSEDDYEYLRSQPGFDPKVCRRLRRERCRLFREYLRSMRREFNGIQRALKVLAINSPIDETPLLMSLLSQQWQFSVLLSRVELRLVLFQFGWSGGDVTPLLNTFESLCDGVQGLCRQRLGADFKLELAGAGV
jgi:hypothetical protein